MGLYFGVSLRIIKRFLSYSDSGSEPRITVLPRASSQLQEGSEVVKRLSREKTVRAVVNCNVCGIATALY
jgi:hypothetical protein